MNLDHLLEVSRGGGTRINMKPGVEPGTAYLHVDGVDCQSVDAVVTRDAIFPKPGTFGSDVMSYSAALAAVKSGYRVARAGWNGKGMFLSFVNDIHDIQEGGTRQPCYRLTWFPEQEYKSLPWIGLKTADDCFVPWLASQTDMLAEDWQFFD